MPCGRNSYGLQRRLSYKQQTLREINPAIPQFLIVRLLKSLPVQGMSAAFASPSILLRQYFQYSLELLEPERVRTNPSPDPAGLLDLSTQ
jgi:hypothetical protein